MLRRLKYYFLTFVINRVAFAMAASISLGRHYEKFCKDLTEGGRFNSVSEVVRAGLRLLEEQNRLAEIRERELTAALQAGIDSPDAGDIDEVMARVLKKFKAKTRAKNGTRKT